MTPPLRCGYPQRTEKSVQESDGPVIFSLAPKLTGGSSKSTQLVDKHGKPWIHLPGGQSDPASRLLAFIAENGICALNIAGARASKEPDIYRLVKRPLEDAFFPQPTRESGDSG